MLKYNVHVPVANSELYMYMIVHISARLYDIQLHVYRKSDVFAMFFIMFVLDYVEALKIHVGNLQLKHSFQIGQLAFISLEAFPLISSLHCC